MMNDYYDTNDLILLIETGKTYHLLILHILKISI